MLKYVIRCQRVGLWEEVVPFAFPRTGKWRVFSPQQRVPFPGQATYYGHTNHMFEQTTPAPSFVDKPPDTEDPAETMQRLVAAETEAAALSAAADAGSPAIEDQHDALSLLEQGGLASGGKRLGHLWSDPRFRWSDDWLLEAEGWFDRERRGGISAKMQNKSEDTGNKRTGVRRAASSLVETLDKVRKKKISSAAVLGENRDEPANVAAPANVSSVVTEVRGPGLSVDPNKNLNIRSLDTTCQDGEVRVSDSSFLRAYATMYPEIKSGDQWWPICSVGFTKNAHGATTFCKSLGFTAGVAVETGSTFPKFAMGVGECKENEPLSRCSGGNGTNAFGEKPTAFVARRTSPSGAGRNREGRVVGNHVKNGARDANNPLLSLLREGIAAQRGPEAFSSEASSHRRKNHSGTKGGRQRAHQTGRRELPLHGKGKMGRRKQQEGGEADEDLLSARRTGDEVDDEVDEDHGENNTIPGAEDEEFRADEDAVQTDALRDDGYGDPPTSSSALELRAAEKTAPVDPKTALMNNCKAGKHVGVAVQCHGLVAAAGAVHRGSCKDASSVVGVDPVSSVEKNNTTKSISGMAAGVGDSQCVDGDVRASKASGFGDNAVMEAETFFSGKWYPVCSDNFTPTGVVSICKKLGFATGSSGGNSTKTLQHDAMPVGTCNAGEELYRCTGGNNKWGLLGENGVAGCRVGQDGMGVTVKCTGGVKGKRYRSSCKGAASPEDKTTSCGDGDVRISAHSTLSAGSVMIPEVSLNGKFYPICMHGFQDDNHGAETICKKLSFKTGTVKKIGEAFEKDAMPVGKCKQDEELVTCTGGDNAWGNFVGDDGQRCKKGSPVSFGIICTGGKNTVASSCGGQGPFTVRKIGHCWGNPTVLLCSIATTPSALILETLRGILVASMIRLNTFGDRELNARSRASFPTAAGAFSKTCLDSSLAGEKFCVRVATGLTPFEHERVLKGVTEGRAKLSSAMRKAGLDVTKLDSSHLSGLESIVADLSRKRVKAMHADQQALDADAEIILLDKLLNEEKKRAGDTPESTPLPASRRMSWLEPVSCAHDYTLELARLTAISPQDETAALTNYKGNKGAFSACSLTRDKMHCNGCAGGQPAACYLYAHEYGVTLNSCASYKASMGDGSASLEQVDTVSATPPTCNKLLTDSAGCVEYPIRGSLPSHIVGEKTMMYEIWKEGPIVSGIKEVTLAVGRAVWEVGCAGLRRPSSDFCRGCYLLLTGWMIVRYVRTDINHV